MAPGAVAARGGRSHNPAGQREVPGHARRRDRDSLASREQGHRRADAGRPPAHAEERGLRPRAGLKGATATVASDGHRTLGIDRRTVWPALLVLALAVVLSVVLPGINGEAAYRDEIHKGDIVELADGITLVPSPGWNLAAGSLLGHTRSPVGSIADTELVNGSVDLNIQAAPFDGTPSALLTRVNQINADLHRARGRDAATTGRYPVTTRQGVVGLAEDFVGVARQGSIVAFVFSPRGT